MTACDLRTQLEHHRISVSQLATEMGVSDRAVRWWKAGRRGIPEDAVVRATDRILAKRDGYREGRADAAAAAKKAILEYSVAGCNNRIGRMACASDTE